MPTQDGITVGLRFTPRWLGLRIVYLVALALALVGTQLPSALGAHAAHPLPLWHLGLFLLAFLAGLWVRIPISGTVAVNASVAIITAVLLIAGVPPTLWMIAVGQALFYVVRSIQRRQWPHGDYLVRLLYDFGNNIAMKTIAVVAAGIALLPFEMVPWDGRRPWPQVVEIVFPLLMLVLVYTIIDALCASFWQNIGDLETIRRRTIALVELVGLWKVCLAFLGLAGAVLYTTNLWWMLGLMAFVIFLQMMYGRHVSLLQAAGTASDSLRQAVSGDAAQQSEEEPDHPKALVRYSKLAAEQLINDRELLAYKDEVVSLLAHDLRNPLATIGGFATLLQRRAAARPDGERDASDLKRVLAQIKHMATLLDLLVVSSRGDTDIFSVSLRPTDLGALVTESVAQVRTGAPDFLWTVDVQEYSPVQCDPDRITQVLTNLLQNAVKYSPTGSTIAIVLQERNGEAILSVRDQGIGVPAADLERIFMRLQRGSNVAGRAPGLGAGLYIVSRIVGAHGGRTWVESEEGGGSTFYVALPLSRETMPAAGWP